MTVYAIAQLTIHDRPRYDRYVAAFMPVLTKYGGRLLVVDDQPEVVEGQWGGSRVIVLSFPDRDSFTTWMSCAEYQEIVQDRLAAAEGPILLVQGVT